MALLAAYNFDEASGDFLDVTGNGHSFPVNNNAVRAAGHTGNSLTKNGVGLPVIANPAFGKTAHRTVMCWVLGTGTTWIVRWQSDSLGSGTWGLLHIGGNIAVQARNTAGTLVTRPVFPHPADGAWHHYAATYDGAAVKLFVDGVFRSQTALIGGLNTSADRIDCAEWSVANTFLDDLRIYDTALDEATIAALMSTPVAPPSPPAALTATLPIAFGAAGVLDVPAASVPQLTAVLPVAVSLAATVDTPPATVPTLTAALAVALDLAGALDTPAADVPTLTSTLPVLLTVAGQLDDGIAQDITLTAALAAPRWTASLGASMTSPTATPIDREVYRLSREFIELAITVGGSPLTGGYTYAVLPLPDEPADVAAINSTPITLSGKTGFMVGPGSSHVLDPGEYHVFARYVDDPEAPVIPVAGRLVITRGANL